MKVTEEIQAERDRQINAEGWTPEHDDKHTAGEMACAAATYAFTSRYSMKGQKDTWANILWPWAWGWWKPTNQRRDLIKAAALIVAEIERLDRLDSAEGGGK